MSDERPALDVRALACAVGAGVLCGAVAVAFRQLLHWAALGYGLILATLGQSVLAWLVLAPLFGAGAALAGWLTLRFAPEASGSGIPHVEAALEDERRMRWRRLVPVKFVGGLLALGSGLSLGREGPTVQMGAAIAHAMAVRLRLDAEARRALMSAGAGAGLAAAFNAPLAGFIFVLEELRRSATLLTYVTALPAALLATLVVVVGLGAAPVFNVSPATGLPLRTLPAFVVVGVGCGVLGLVFNRSLIRSLDGFARLRVRPRWLAPAAVGVLAATIACIMPAAIGDGEPEANALLQATAAQGLAGRLLTLLSLKLLLTVLSYGSGVPGGIFAPLLLLGAALGALVSLFLTSAPPVALAIAGMAGLFAAVVRVPVIGMVLVVEMTRSQDLLLYLVATCTVSYVVAAALGGRPVYELLRERDERARAETPASARLPAGAPPPAI